MIEENLAIIVASIASFVGGGGIIKVLESNRLARTDERTNDHKLIDQLQEQMNTLATRIGVLETKNDEMALKITELEKDNVRLETENKFLKKEIEMLKSGEDEGRE